MFTRDQKQLIAEYINNCAVSFNHDKQTITIISPELIDTAQFETIQDAILAIPNLLQPRKLYNAREVADMLGITPEAVKQQARNGDVGDKVNKKAWVFTEQDIAKLKDRPGRGRPAKE